ncbi:MAG: hypothetical protein AAF078_02115 [Planctomycetota bacterium]
MPAWNGWYHLMANTHGTWLPGDPRGFRTRAHREHVDGDYKSPPTQDYTTRHAAAKHALNRDPVVLSPQARHVALEALHHAFVEVHNLEVLAVAVGAKHLHVLTTTPSDSASEAHAFKAWASHVFPRRPAAPLSRHRQERVS